jgi:hypothetical protein
MEKKEQIASAKSALVEVVERKKQNTKERVAYKKATPVSNPERFGKLLSFWWVNKDLKEEIRHRGLALAFLRGSRYWFVERVANSAPIFEVVAEFAGAAPEVVGAWLQEKPSPEEKVTFESHLAAAKVKAREDYTKRSAARRAA